MGAYPLSKERRFVPQAQPPMVEQSEWGRRRLKALMARPICMGGGEECILKLLCEILHHRFDNVATLKRLQKEGGYLVVARHGTEDEVIPVAMGRKLGELFPGLVTYEDIAGARHNDVLNTDTDKVHAALEGVR
jgi:hypothetical protein